MLMQLASVGGEFSHVLHALTLAFDVAGDNEELVATIADGLSSAHAPALTAVMQQDVSRLPVAFAAVPFLDGAAREDARRRLDGVGEAGQRLATAAGRLKPNVKAALATALAVEVPLGPHVGQAFDGVVHLPDETQAAEIAELAPWLELDADRARARVPQRERVRLDACFVGTAPADGGSRQSRAS